MAAQGAISEAAKTSYWAWLKRYWGVSIPAGFFVGAEFALKLMPEIDILKYLKGAFPNIETASGWIDFSSCLFNAAILLVVFTASCRIGTKHRRVLDKDGKKRFSAFWDEWLLFLGLYVLYYLVCAPFAYPCFRIAHGPTNAAAPGTIPSAGIPSFLGGFQDTRPGAVIQTFVENCFSVFVALYLVRATTVLFASRFHFRDARALSANPDVEEDQRHVLKSYATACNIGALCLMCWLTFCGVRAFLIASAHLPDSYGWSTYFAWSDIKVDVLKPLDTTANCLFAFGFVLLTMQLLIDQRLRPSWEIVTLFLGYAALEIFLINDSHTVLFAVLRGTSAMAKFLMFFWVAWLVDTERLSAFLGSGVRTGISGANKPDEHSGSVPQVAI